MNTYLKYLAVILLAFVLGCCGGLLMDWLFPYSWSKLWLEGLIGAYIGLAVSLRTRSWWIHA